MRGGMTKRTMAKSYRKRPSMKGRTASKKGFLLVIVLIGLLGWSQGGQAQEYPTRSINLLISFPAGGVVDVCARKLVPEVTKILGQEIVVINRPGGGGALAVGLLASAKGDGYTLLAHTTSSLTNAPHLESLPYDPLKDIIPIVQFGTLVVPFVVRSDSPLQSFKDLVEFARKNPGKVSCGNPGVATTPHLALELVKLQEKVNITIIPFDGTPQAMTALLGGHITVCGLSITAVMPYLKAGKIRVLAVTSERRIEVLPDVPTLVELGYPQGAIGEIYLFSTPKGTSPAVVKKLEGTFRKAMETPEFRNLVRDSNLYVPNPLSSETLKGYIEKEYTKNGEIIRKAILGK